MPKDEVIYRTRRPAVVLRYKLIQSFLLPAEAVSSPGTAAGIGLVGPKAEGKGGMQEAEAPLHKAVMKKLEHKAVLPVSAPKCIPVSYTETLSGKFEALRLGNLAYSYTGKERVSPDVVIAWTEYHLDAFVH